MEFNCVCGSTFILNGHLWVIANDPTPETDEVIILFLTTKKETSDTTTILSEGDHNFIKHETVVSYENARIEKRESIQARIAQRDFEPRESFDQSVMIRICEGLLASPRTSREIKKKFKHMI